MHLPLPLRSLPARSLLVLGSFFAVSAVSVAAAGEPIDLTGPLVDGGNAYYAFLASDGARVVFQADKMTRTQYEVYSVRPDGSDLRNVFGPLPFGADVFQFGVRLSADGQTVVAQADLRSPGQYELFSAPAGGGPVQPIAGVVNLDFESGSDGVEFGFEITPDNTRVVFLAGVRVFATPLRTNAPIDLLPGEPGTTVDAFSLASVGDRVLLRATSATGRRLVAVPAGGGAPVEISGPQTPGRGVGRWRVTQQGDRVVYVADGSAGDSALWSATLTGERTELVTGLTSRDWRSFVIAPAGDRVALSLSNVVWSVPIAGGEWVPLTQTVASDFEPVSFDFLPDSSRVVSRIRVGAETWLVSTAASGGVPLVLSDVNTVSAWRASPDSGTVLFLADRNEAGRDELFAVPPAGGPLVQLSGALVAGEVRSVHVAPDGRYAVFLADDLRTNNVRAFQVPPSGGEAALISGSLASVSAPQIAPDSSAVFLMGYAGPGAPQRIYRTDFVEPGPPPARLPWTIRWVRPRDGKSVRFRSKKGLNARGFVEQTGLPPGSRGIQVRCALLPNVATNVVPWDWTDRVGVGPVNRKGNVPFRVRNLGAGWERPVQPTQWTLAAVASGSNFALARSDTNTLALRVR